MDRKNKFDLMVKKSMKNEPHMWRLAIIMVAWFIFIAITKGSRFYSVLNFQIMFSQFPEFGLMSLGVMVCMITGGIDLSTVGIANLTSICMAMLMRSVANANDELGTIWFVLVFVLAVIIGIAAGIVNGALISKLKIPPILATLGTGELFSGIGIVLTNGSAISDFPKNYSYAINNTLFGIPVQFMIFAIVAVALALLMKKTNYGKKILLLGTNQNVAKYSGLKVDKILIKTYVISGICAALGGMIMLANYNSARSGYGANYTLQCIMIVVLGGISPTGGKGKIGGVLIAIILVKALETGINRFPQISSFYISLIWGAVLLIVMVLDYLSTRNIKLFNCKSI